MATQNDSTFREEQSTIRPPYFNGNDYPYWKIKMRIYLQVLDYEIWEIVNDGSFMPLTKMKSGKIFQNLHGIGMNLKREKLL